MGGTAVVTGASRGIGQRIAIRLAQAGWNVAVNDIFEGPEEYQETIAGIEEAGARGRFYPADVTGFDAVKEMMARIVADFGSLDVLVNNAGITRDGLLLRMKEEDFDRVIDVNLKSVFNCCRHAAPYMVKQRCGRIISMASVVGLAGQAGQTNYAASKGGIIAFTKALAQEIGSRNITVNAIAPGFVDTAMTRAMPAKARDAILDRIPLGHGAQTDDIASTAVFLASEEAAYITGQVISVNGGMYM